MAEKKYPHAGHRQRLRNEFLEHGFEKWDEVKILEYMLFYIIPRSDTNDMARRLLDRFGNMKGVLEAPYKMLEDIDGIGKNAVVFIKSLNEFVHFYNKIRTNGKIYLTPDIMEVYFQDMFKKHRRECFYMICLDARKAVIRKDLISEGAFDASELDVGRIVRLAVCCEAAGVILAHNHPGGSLEPSGVDLTATQIVRNSLKLVGVLLYEHIIVTDEGVRGFIDRVERLETEKNIQKYTVNP